MMVYVSVSQKTLMYEKYIVTSRYCTVRREIRIATGRQMVPDNLIWNFGLLHTCSNSFPEHF